MDELFVRAELLGLVTFGDGGGEIALPIQSHADRKLGVEVLRVLGENGTEGFNGVGIIALAEGEHRVVVTFLKRGHK